MKQVTTYRIIIPSKLIGQGTSKYKYTLMNDIGESESIGYAAFTSFNKLMHRKVKCITIKEFNTIKKEKKN